MTSAIVKFNAQKEVSVGILNILPHKITISRNASVAKVTILTAKQAQYLQLVSPEVRTQYFTQSVNALVADSDSKVLPSSDDLWFPTPENC